MNDFILKINIKNDIIIKKSPWAGVSGAFMIKIVQFGEGNFLRTFADLYFDTLNKEGGEYKVNIIKPIPFGSLEKFKNQNYKYHVVLRGVSGGKDVENVSESVARKSRRRRSRAPDLR